MNRRSLVAAGLALALAVSAGCSPSPEPPAGDTGGEAPRRGGTVVLTNRTDVDTVNDLIGNGSVHGRDVERWLFLQLVRELPSEGDGPPTFEPQLAERWELDDDRRTLTFHLREAFWSDGVPLTAEDVRWTWQAQTHPEIGWRLASRKEPIADVEVVDARTVRFHFGQPASEPIEVANAGGILPRHVWGEKPFAEWRAAGRWFADTLVASGPFVLTRWEPNQEMVLDRNPRYHEPGLPLLDRLVVRIVPEKATQVAQLLGGTLDYVRVVPADQVERLEASAGIEIEAYAGRSVDYLCWNTRHAPLGDAAVRRALTLATDRQSIVDAVYGGYARVAVTTVISTTWAFDDSLEPWPYDPAEARRVLAATGFEDRDGDGVIEREGVPLELDLLVQSGNRTHLDAATLLQAQLARVGVRLELRPTEFQTWVERLKSQEFEVAIGGWTIPSNLDMSFAFHTQEIGNWNFGAFSNPALDALLDDAAAAEDLERRRELLHRVQAVLHAEQPYTFLWEPLTLDGRSARLRDTRPNALSSYFNIVEWWLAEG